MYCRNCGTTIPDASRFCPECGKQVVRDIENESSYIPECGTLTVTCYNRSEGNIIPVELWINGSFNQIIHNWETVVINLPAGEYTVTLIQQSQKLLSQTIRIRDGGNETISFEVNSPTPTRSNKAPKKISKYGERTCPRCGDVLTLQIVTESKKAGCFTVLLYILLSLTILGLLIVIPLALRKKTETVTYAICQSCGYQKVIKRV